MKILISVTLAAMMASPVGAASAKDALIGIMNAVGNDCENIEITEIPDDSLFLIGLDEEDADGVLSAAMTLETSEDGSAKWIILCESGKAAKKIYGKLWKSYEFPACDNAEKAVFLKAGRAVAFFKGTGEAVGAYSRAFGDAFGAEGVKILKNPAKMTPKY